MEECPQCNTERISGESFCDNCGHKYAFESQSEQQITPPPQPRQQPTMSRARITILDNVGEEIKSFYFEDSPQIIERQDVTDILSSVGKDPLQVSRKQCTLIKEGDNYYIEDGVTSVQDKPSGNHTTVNGQDITGKGRTKLSDNDKIVLATSIDAVFYAK